MAKAGVTYEKYVNLFPDVVTYEFHECFSSQ